MGFSSAAPAPSIHFCLCLHLEGHDKAFSQQRSYSTLDREVNWVGTIDTVYTHHHFSSHNIIILTLITSVQRHVSIIAWHPSHSQLTSRLCFAVAMTGQSKFGSVWGLSFFISTDYWNVCVLAVLPTYNKSFSIRPLFQLIVGLKSALELLHPSIHMSGEGKGLTRGGCQCWCFVRPKTWRGQVLRMWAMVWVDIHLS